MKKVICLILAIVLPSGFNAVHAQDATVDKVELPIVKNAEIEGTLVKGSLHSYLIDLEAENFVNGSVHQLSVDVVVTIYDPAEQVLATFDNPARGPEVFQFETETAGSHRIEVKPFKEEVGDYTVVVDRVEPIATTPDARVDQLMASYDREAVPGGVVGVMKEGQLVFSRPYGAADLAHMVPFTLETRTNIGSTSKQFTAFAVCLLADRGELSLDDDVREYIPELPDFGKTVTLRHLMTHTSGYREFLNTIALTGRKLGEAEYIDREELIEVVQRQPELQNDPGAEWNYNNTAFGLLTMVVERVSETPFSEWMRLNVFEPLGMLHTMVRANQSQIIPNRSTGYLLDDEGSFKEAGDLGGAMGAGGIYTTVDDMAKWMKNYHEPVVGNENIFEEMMTPYVLSDGDTTNYGLGLMIGEMRGLKVVQHGGADIAHRSMMMYYPEINSGVVAFSNYGPFNNPATAVAEAFLSDRMTQDTPVKVTQEEETETAVFDPESYDPEAFDAYVGRYELVPGFVITASREDEDLLVQATGQSQLMIYPTSDSTFMLKVVEASLTFHRDAEGKVTGMTLHQNGMDQLGKRLEEEPWQPSDEELTAFEGRYFSEELETFYEIRSAEGKLKLYQRRIGEMELNPAKADAFTGSFPIGEIVFQREEDGEITGFKVSNGRTRGILFEKNS